MTKLIITRGLPGSGKTTWARKQPAVRVNRDALRAMLLPEWPHGDEGHENLLTGIQRCAAGFCLEFEVDVVIDDTNLRPDVVEYWRRAADVYGADFAIVDFTRVPLEVCIARDAARPDQVGEDVIRRMHAKYLAPQEEASKP